MTQRRGCRAALALAVFIASPALAGNSPVLSQMRAFDLSGRMAGQAPPVTLFEPSAGDGFTHPPPDLEDLWLTVLLKMSPSTTPSPGSYGTTWYVSVRTGGDKPVDLPATAIAKVSIPGIKILPVSAASNDGVGGRLKEGDCHIGIGFPLKRPDGNYDVTYSSYCGVVWGSSMTAIMNHGQWGWRIVSTRRDFVS